MCEKPKPRLSRRRCLPFLHQSTKVLTAVAQYEYEAAEDNELSLVEGEHIVDIVQEDADWWSGTSADGTRHGLFPAAYVALVELVAEAGPELDVGGEAPPSLFPESVPPVAAITTEPQPDLAPDESVVAIALYDYDAAEDNELTFREGDRITDIEAISEDWWSGHDQHGNAGLFPATYVEVQQSE
ncbi:SH3 domain-containing protein [Russula earlei]|uniref:SH3 domain-containing protein n=1 Tax=Russula earlei TaxID=71964 RepID=A0ACC0UN57_9AGAM|nr:SH3 domain-containing protein [Russula earlei]